MKYKIVKNKEKKTVTAIISPVIITFVDYLYERYNGEKFFASGVLQGADFKEEITPLLKEIVTALNDVAGDRLPKGQKYEGKDLLTLNEDEYRLFSKNLNKDKEWDKQFKVNLQSKSKDDEKRFLFEDFQCTKPVKKDDGWKYEYAIELEIGAGYNEDNFEKYVFALFHRAIKVGVRENASNFSENDQAWEGFDFGDQEEEKDDLSDIDIKEDDLPF